MVSYQNLEDVSEGQVLFLDPNYIYVVSKPITIKGTLNYTENSTIYIVNGPYDLNIKKRSNLWIAPEGSVLPLLLVDNEQLSIYGVEKIDENEYVIASQGNNGGFIVSGSKRDYIPDNPYLKNYPARKIPSGILPTSERIVGTFNLYFLGSNIILEENNVSYTLPFCSFVGLEYLEIRFGLNCYNLENRNTITFYNTQISLNNLYALGFDCLRILDFYDNTNINLLGTIVILNQFVKRNNSILRLTNNSSLEFNFASFNAVSLSLEDNIIVSGPDEYIYRKIEFEEFYVRSSLNVGFGCKFSI